MDSDHMEIEELGLVPMDYGFLNPETGEMYNHDGENITEEATEED